MDQELKIPVFESEAQEADWWFENREILSEQFVHAGAEGRLGKGSLARSGNTSDASIRLDPADISKAREQADRRGLHYQVYLKILIHEALQREEKLAS